MMKLKFLIICSFIILIIQQCKSQTNQKLNELNNFETLTQIFENEMMLAALIDRVTFHSHILNMNTGEGELSYRLSSALSGNKQ